MLAAPHFQNDYAALIVPGAPTTQDQVAHNSVAPVTLGDRALSTATEYLKAADKAVEKQENRERMSPGLPDKLVKEKKGRRVNTNLILGGPSVIPM